MLEYGFSLIHILPIYNPDPLYGVENYFQRSKFIFSSQNLLQLAEI